MLQNLLVFLAGLDTGNAQRDDKNIVDTFDLIDCKEFLKMADLVRDKLPDVWTNLLKL